jgi:hypothetical protein
MDEPSPPPSTAPGTASENPTALPKQRAPNLQELSALLGMGGDHGLPTRTPDPEMVMETLDAEMSRIEQALVRSGWTSWVGTAALAGILWVFVSLFDVGAMFPWPRFAALVALLSFVQEFVYCLDNALRPRRGLGLLVGDQMRMVVSAETLPFARRYYLFEGVRALLLVAASWYLLPVLIGWGWLLPFVWYAAAVVTMCVLFALSLRKRFIPKRLKFFPGELVRHAILLGMACYGLHALADSWAPADFVALKGALLAVAAIHVMRGLVEPRFELPALESLREIRRKLGFAQITAPDAVIQADGALFGYNALLVLARPLQEVGAAIQPLYAHQRHVAEDLEVLARQVATLASQEHVTPDELALREGLASQIVARIGEAADTLIHAAAAHARFLERIEHHRTRTVNDRSLSLVLQLAKRQNLARTTLGSRLAAAASSLGEQLDALDAIAARHQHARTSDVRKAANAAAQRLASITVPPPARSALGSAP